MNTHPTHRDVRGALTVREVLEAAREAAIELRKLEEQMEVKLQSIGVQGHNSSEIHAKSSVLDPMRHVVELMDWQTVATNREDLQAAINEAYQIVAGISHITDGFTVEVVTRYYLQGESWKEIVDGYEYDGQRMTPITERTKLLDGLKRADQFKVLEEAMKESIAQWERIGIAHLKEMGNVG